MTAAIVGAPAVAAHFWFRTRSDADERVLIVVPIVVVGLVGYLTFWAFFVHPVLGQLFSFAVPLTSWIAVVRLGRKSREHVRLGGLGLPALIAVGLGLFYLGVLYLPKLGHAYADQAAYRFVHDLPIDSVIPQIFGDRLFFKEPLRPFIVDWLSSDRPPLQAGLYLSVLPWLQLFHVPRQLGYECLGTQAQLLWVPAAWLLARALGLNRTRRTVALLVVGSVGFFLLNSVYVWPKLLAAAYVVLFALLILERSPHHERRVMILAGACAGLAWLAHGGVAFSLIALAPFWIAKLCPGWRRIPAGAITGLLLVIPWVLFQRFYDPPGNHLLKWHLAGVTAIDDRGVVETLRAAYSALSFDTWLAGKRYNLAVLFGGSFTEIFNIFTTPIKPRRIHEFFYLFRAMGLLNLAWFLWPAARSARNGTTRPNLSLRWTLVGWTLLTLALWILLMFEPGSTLLHQGSYAVMLVGCTLAVVILLEIPFWLSAIVLGWHFVYFSATWLPYTGSAKLNPGEFVVMGIGILLLAAAVKVARQLDRKHEALGA
ncbi:hypothetical protein K0B96_03870 [Horticoccus luteus]|uniref:Uncharacterized protein n=1 Tax=Horticoccus luteus TaxID=2862869 RepID=A0A8F9XHV8_9BACT|nr:hypothetical protein [Horticoccus luteus]QYM79765.1 hypothetical protein K0B96_03870 [Horticoccus luteus]